MSLNVFVTGGAGYVGSVLVKNLILRKHKVTIVDRMFFGTDSLKDFETNVDFCVKKIDIRDIVPKDLEGFDAVIDLAALSNDPAGDLDPNLTFDINENGRVNIAKCAKEAGVLKYVLSSTCSVYGGSEEICDEDSKANPLSVYAQAAHNAEKRILQLFERGTFEPTIFRNGTVHGLSPRMRFDLVINVMVKNAFQYGEINVLGSGIQWRPLIHTEELANSFILAVEDQGGKIGGEIFNIATENQQISTLAFKIRDALPIHVKINKIPQDEDRRDYRVSTSKAESVGLLNSALSIGESAIQIYSALLNGLSADTEKFITVNWYKKIIEARKLLDEIELNGRLI